MRRGVGIGLAPLGLFGRKPKRREGSNDMDTITPASAIILDRDIGLRLHRALFRRTLPHRRAAVDERAGQEGTL